jgi:hypothetical protein
MVTNSNILDGAVDLSSASIDGDFSGGLNGVRRGASSDEADFDPADMYTTTSLSVSDRVSLFKSTTELSKCVVCTKLVFKAEQVVAEGEFFGVPAEI